MKAKIDYGIYIDRKHAFIVSLNHMQHEQFISEDVLDNEEGVHADRKTEQQEHIQNRAHEYLIKMCRSVATQLKHPNSIVIFGPSNSKYVMQKEISDSPEFKNVHIELRTTDVMNKNEAIHYVKDQFTTITVGQQIFTAPKK